MWLTSESRSARMLRTHALRVLLCAALVFALAGSPHAITRGPLPQFALSQADGAAVHSDQLVRPGTWVIVYVTPECAACRALLNAIDKSETRRQPSSIVVVVAAARAADLQIEASRYADHDDVVWLADMANAMPQQLATSGAPTIIGLRGRTIEWSVAGVLTNDTELMSIIGAWLDR